MWNHQHDWIGMWPFPIIMVIILLIGLYLIFRPKYPMDSERHEETALDILKKRYASGEISREEYQQMKDDLSEE